MTEESRYDWIKVLPKSQEAAMNATAYLLSNRQGVYASTQSEAESATIPPKKLVHAEAKTGKQM